MQNFGQLLGTEDFAKPEDIAMVEALTGISKRDGEQSVPIIFEAESTPSFGFVAQLPRKYLRCDLSELRGEATVFGKVQRIIPKGKQEEIYNLLPALESYQATLNRAERRKMQKEKKEQNMAEQIKGPAIILIPLAIYR